MVCSLFFLICQWQGAGTEEACLIDILASRSNDEIKAINAFYKKSESQRTSMNRYSMRGPGPACRDTWYCIVPLTKLPYGHWLTSVTFYEHTADRRNEVSGRICFNRLFCFLDLIINSVFGFVTGASSIPHFATKVNFFFLYFFTSTDCSYSPFLFQRLWTGSLLPYLTWWNMMPSEPPHIVFESPWCAH